MEKSRKKISLRERLNISRIAIKYSWLTVCFWLAVSVAGLFAFSSLKYDLFPDVTFPVVLVRAEAPIASAVETETSLTKPIENSVESFKGLQELYSVSFPGQAAVSLLLEAGENLKSSTEKVRTAVEELSLPEEATLEVIPFNLNESGVVSYAITKDSEGKSDREKIQELIQIAQQQIIPQIQELPGVLRVNLLGDDTPPEPENSLLPSDRPATLVRINGKQAVAFEVIKQGDANILEVVGEVEDKVDELRSSLSDVEITLAQTKADYITEAVEATVRDLILAIILAVLVIYPFLGNLRATFITALAIPISMLGTCIVMAIFGFNLETITLLAIALTIGIVVDDAIVDVENISRHIEQGENPRSAAIAATNEIGITVIISTLTIVAVFLPVALMGGSVGKFFKPFGITVSAAVLTSLLVARTLSPVLSVYWLKAKPTKTNKQNNNNQNNFPIPDLRSLIVKPYYQLLKWSLNHRKIVVGIALLSFIAGIALIPFVPTGFIPKLDRGEFNIIYTTTLPSRLVTQENLDRQMQTTTDSQKTESSSGMFSIDPRRFLLYRTITRGEKLEKSVLESPDVGSVYDVAGARGELYKGQMYVRLNGDRTKHTAEVQEDVRSALPELRGVSVSVEDVKFVDTGDEKPLKIALIGDNLDILNETAQKIKTEIEKLPGLLDVDASGKENKNIILKIERQNRQRVVYVSANLSKDTALGDATERVVALATPLIPEGVELQLAGDSARMGEVLGSFAFTAGLSVICILVVLYSLFGRLLEPIAIGISIPLSIVGAMLALLITRSDFGMISVIGLIFLMGLVQKISILLIDYATLLRREGLSRTEAILETGKARLRPILMTTTSTILGMTPIALGLGAGSELRQPMAVAIIGGLITSTLLSLIIVPIVYTLLDDGWNFLFGRKSEKEKEKEKITYNR